MLGCKRQRPALTIVRVDMNFRGHTRAAHGQLKVHIVVDAEGREIICGGDAARASRLRLGFRD
jgi:hypothetical protein